MTARDGGSVERTCRWRGLLLLLLTARSSFSSHIVPVLRALPLELTLSLRVRNTEVVEQQPRFGSNDTAANGDFGLER